MPDIPQPETVKTVERRLDGQPKGQGGQPRPQPRKQVETYAKQHNAAVIVISAEIESQLAQLPDAEQSEYLESLRLKREASSSRVTAALS